MLVRDCMTKKVELASPDLTIQEAAKKMKDGDFGSLPIGEDDRLVGMVTDRDIAIRAVAEGKDPTLTLVRDVMSEKVLYCFDDETIEAVATNMGNCQVRRLPVVNREKRLVGILSLGDLAEEEDTADNAKEALSKISEHEHREKQTRVPA